MPGRGEMEGTEAIFCTLAIVMRELHQQVKWAHHVWDILLTSIRSGNGFGKRRLRNSVPNQV